MDSYEATRMVFSRIQSLDPENASKIMGYLLIQDHGEKEMIRLAFGPETLLHNLIIKAKTHLGLITTSSSSTTATTTPFNPISRPNPLSISSRITNNGCYGYDVSNPSSPSTWSASGGGFSSPHSPNPNSVSYANIVNGGGSNNSSSNPESLSPSAFPFYGSSNTNNNTSNYGGGELIDDYQFQDHLSFLNDSKSDDLFDPTARFDHTHLLHHRRSYSVPVVDHAAGATNNIVGSPNKLNEFEQCQELLRSKRKLAAAAAAQFMSGGGAGGATSPVASYPYNKCMNFLLQDTQRSALMMGDELMKFGRCRPERNHDFLGGGCVNPGSRQIYLTFPADSTFREEDVSNYFSIYGPVQDVRIPYQQKRMFGFVTFVYPETVKLILAKGNPHFVCDSRVLVKPYKEKGKVPDKKQHQQQQMERGEYSACSSPSGVDSREPFDFHLGARMFYNTQEMLLRRKLEEQADLQQAIELQGRRLMNLQLLDLKNNHHHHHHHHQFHHGLSNASPMPSPTTLSHTPSNQNNHTLIFTPDDEEVPEDTQNVVHDSDEQQQQEDQEQEEEMNPATSSDNNGNGNNSNTNNEESDLHESLEHILPDNLFASPKKLSSTGDHNNNNFSSDTDEKITSSNNTTTTTTLLPSTNLTPLNSCFLQIPRFSSGHGTIGM